MASATRVQMWTYAVLLLLATLLATLLGTAVAEAASTEPAENSSGWQPPMLQALTPDTPNTPSPLSLLIGGFAFSLATFSYLLML